MEARTYLYAADRERLARTALAPLTRRRGQITETSSGQGNLGVMALRSRRKARKLRPVPRGENSATNLQRPEPTLVPVRDCWRHHLDPKLRFPAGGALPSRQVVALFAREVKVPMVYSGMEGKCPPPTGVSKRASGVCK